MSKLIIIAAFIAVAFAAEPLNGRDILGNFYDGTTGQVSSSLTGRVYNTRVQVAPATYVAAHPAQAVVAAPLVAHAPVAYSAPVVVAAPVAHSVQWDVRGAAPVAGYLIK